MSENEELTVVRPELLQIAEAVARDKSIEQTIVIEAMEQAIQSVAKKKYGQDLEVKASIDEKTDPLATSLLSREVFLFTNKAFNVSINIDLPEPVCPVKTVNPLSKSISKFPNRAIF